MALALIKTWLPRSMNSFFIHVGSDNSRSKQKSHSRLPPSGWPVEGFPTSRAGIVEVVTRKELRPPGVGRERLFLAIKQKMAYNFQLEIPHLPGKRHDTSDPTIA